MKNKKQLSELEDEEGNTIIDDGEKAELLNKYFSSVFTVENLTDMPVPDPLPADISPIEDIELDLADIKKRILKLNTSKSAGPDKIHSKILFETIDQVAPLLLIIFSKSLEEGQLPTQWKEANVTPIFKKGRKKSPCNYRPVSLTSICCKLLERIIRDRIVLHLEQLGLLDKNQHGFRGGMSCNTQLLEIMESWTTFFELGLPWDCIYMDFAKAFDSVPHERLLLKIESYGIRGKLLGWIRNFLSNRRQRVTIGDRHSDWRPVTSGIPQGSVLGPILFVIFINDLPKTVLSHIKLFADDTKIFRAIENIKDFDLIQKDIDTLIKWSSTWQLPFNLQKCKVVHYGKNNPHHHYKIGNSNLPDDTEEKDLGVTFDNELNFRKHVRNTVAKANSRVGLIKRSFTNLDSKSFMLLYKSLVRPLLEYCCNIWYPTTQFDIKEIEKVQRRATKLMKDVRNKSYTERLRHLNIPTLIYRRHRNDMIQVFRIFNKIDKLDINTFFTLNKTRTTRGHQFKLDKPRVEQNKRMHSFSQRVINPWNKLTHETVNCVTLNSFKTALENEWKNIDFKFDPGF